MRKLNKKRHVLFIVLIFCLPVIYIITNNGLMDDLGKEVLVKPGGHIYSDVDQLERVIVLSPGDEMRRITLLANEDHPCLPSDAMQLGAIKQHQTFTRLLESKGVDVLRFDELLNSAIRVAREHDKLDSWIRENYPEASTIFQRDENLEAADLIGRGNFFYHYDENGQFDPLLLPLKWMIFTRDIGVMTPRGFVLCNFANYDRAKETALMRFTFHFAPELSSYSIIFDAEAENVFLQGGDLIVLDENTLLLGVGNLTEPRAAELLAKKLNIDVLAVSMPHLNPREGGYAEFSSVHLQFLHLDTYFTLVDKNKAIAIPYILETQYVNNNPMFRLLNDLDNNLKLMQQTDRIRHKNRSSSVITTLKALKEIGWVTRYEASTGRPIPLEKKLVDIMKEKGYTIIPLGGERGSLSEEQYLLERVFFELNFQGANVVALRPNIVFAYKENIYTIGALEAAGVQVIPYEGSYLAMWHGGSHCLTLPINRVPELK